MLRKLCKYELKASGRVYLVRYAAMLASALVMGLVCFTDLAQGMAGAVIAIIYILVIWTMLVLSLVQGISRFNKNLLKGEGYLMHTLPVSTWQLVLSKLLTGMLMMVATVLVALLSAGVLVSTITIAEGGVSVLGDIWRAAVQTFFDSQLIHGSLTIPWALLIALLGYANFLLMAYAGMAVGQLFHRCRDGIAVAVFFLLGTLEQWIAAGGGALVVTTPAGKYILGDASQTLTYGATTLWLLILGVFHFFLAEELLRRRLNLE